MSNTSYGSNRMLELDVGYIGDTMDVKQINGHSGHITSQPNFGVPCEYFLDLEFKGRFNSFASSSSCEIHLVYYT